MTLNACKSIHNTARAPTGGNGQKTAEIHRNSPLLGDQSQGSWHHDPCPGNTASIREHSLTRSLPKQKDMSPGKGQGDVQVQVPAFRASVRQPGTQSGILDPSSSPGLFSDAAQGFEKVAGEGDLRARASEEALHPGEQAPNGTEVRLNSTLRASQGRGRMAGVESRSFTLPQLHLGS